MNVCDMCNGSITPPEGYLLTTRQVVSNPDYWEYAFSRTRSYVQGMIGADRIKAGLVERQAAQSAPWLLCAECAGQLDLATPEARLFAERWWSSGQKFSPPGSGPVPASEIPLAALLEEVPASGVPRPSRALIFGRGFVPGEEALRWAVGGLVTRHKGKLTPSHFTDIPVVRESRPSANREAFFSVVDEVRRWNPGAFILESLVLDQHAGADTALLALWDGADADKARSLLGGIAPGGLQGTVVKPGRLSASAAVEQRPPKKWTRVVGVVLIVCGFVMLLSGGALLRQPGSVQSTRNETGQARPADDFTDEQAASTVMGLGTVMGGIGIWLTARKRRRGRPSTKPG